MPRKAVPWLTLCALLGACGGSVTDEGLHNDGETGGSSGNDGSSGEEGSGGNVGRGGRGGQGGSVGRGGQGGSVGRGGRGGQGGNLGRGGQGGSFGRGGQGGSLGRGGQGGSLGRGGQGGAATCDDLRLELGRRVDTAKICCPNCLFNQCVSTVPGMCCDETVNIASEDIVDYLTTYERWKAAGCPRVCPATECPSVPSNFCEPTPVGGRCR
jgi:hypothetical protein